MIYYSQICTINAKEPKTTANLSSSGFEELRTTFLGTADRFNNAKQTKENERIKHLSVEAGCTGKINAISTVELAELKELV